MQNHFKHFPAQQNDPNSCAAPVQDLDAMSPVELAENLEQILSSVSDDSYHPELIDAYLDALDRKAPMSQVPDKKVDFLNFQQHLREISPDYAKEKSSSSAHPVRTHRLGRSLLVAAVTLVVTLVMLIGAQAAGLDVFGAIARWTEEVFSLGPIRYVDESSVLPDEASVRTISGNANEIHYSSIQEALDDCNTTDVAMPTWIPDDYVLSSIDVLHTDDPDFLCIIAEYMNDGTDTCLNICVSTYNSEPNMQVELADVNFVEWEENGLTFYLVENSENITIVWCTGYYECYISAAISKEELLEMVHSIFD